MYSAYWVLFIIFGKGKPVYGYKSKEQSLCLYISFYGINFISG